MSGFVLLQPPRDVFVGSDLTVHLVVQRVPVVPVVDQTLKLFYPLAQMLEQAFRGAVVFRHTPMTAVNPGRCHLGARTLGRAGKAVRLRISYLYGKIDDV
jgi:hypothetical protein